MEIKINVFIVVESYLFYSERNRGVFLNLDQAVNNASGAIRIEKHSTVTNELAAIYTTDGELIYKNTV